jgi:hypothetical protein
MDQLRGGQSRIPKREALTWASRWCQSCGFFLSRNSILASGERLHGDIIKRPTICDLNYQVHSADVILDFEYKRNERNEKLWCCYMKTYSSLYSSSKSTKNPSMGIPSLTLRLIF